MYYLDLTHLSKELLRIFSDIWNKEWAYCIDINILLKILNMECFIKFVKKMFTKFLGYIL